MNFKYILVLVLAVVIAAVILLGVIPFVIITSLNVLFGLGIPYTIFTFASAFCLYSLLTPTFIKSN